MGTYTLYATPGVPIGDVVCLAGHSTTQALKAEGNSECFAGGWIADWHCNLGLGTTPGNTFTVQDAGGVAAATTGLGAGTAQRVAIDVSAHCPCQLYDVSTANIATAFLPYESNGFYETTSWPLRAIRLADTSQRS